LQYRNWQSALLRLVPEKNREKIMKVQVNYQALLSLLLLGLTAQGAYATCQDKIPASTPSSDFTVHDNGTVTHNKTGLMWMRCSLGQSWDGSTCSGSAISFTWANALAAAQSHTFADNSDWRLPNKHELASIVEERCANPAINSTVFPNTAGAFWSSSPNASLSNSAWYVSFFYGDASSNLKNHNGVVRLVRVGQ
jgi:hypothetical protein